MRRAWLLLAIAACDPPPPDEVELFRLTNAPPASTASVVNDRLDEVYRVELSVGVAMAIACWDNCGEDEYTSLCTGAKLLVDDEAMLGVRPLYRVSVADRSDFVLVAAKPGLTTLHVETNCAARDYAVNIVPRP
jgi:hypothetical protein